MNFISIKNVTFIGVYALPFFLIYIYFCINQSFNGYEVDYSSVWCKKSLTGSKLCAFKNICYEPEFSSFLFYLSNFSIIRGLSHYHELQKIQLSSIELHNKFEANISIINPNYYPVKNVRRIKRGLLFSRFKPDNIMHVIHDDLIPVFWTLQEICLDDMIFCGKNYQLLLCDNYQKGPHFNLYRVFTNFEPVLLSQTSQVLCFDELQMGLVKNSVFYQYGFNQVQGPVENNDINGNAISHFADFIMQKLNIKTDESKESDIVLISRKKSRRILNEGSLIRMLENACRQNNSNLSCKVITVDLFENGTSVVIKAIKQASMLVGMHGAEMIFSIFLKENSTVVELFPFGIQPHVVSFVKALSKVEGINFHYINWENSFKNHSVFHPDADSLHGGINHLQKSIQDKIRSTEKVPAVKCCNDPTYLYHMYQDTWIDSSFQEFLAGELMKTNSVFTSVQICDKWFFPSTVSKISCQYNHITGRLNVSWMKPFNLEAEALVYDVFVLGQLNFKINIMTGNRSLEVDVSRCPSSNASKFQVWVTAVIKKTNARSKDVYSECT